MEFVVVTGLSGAGKTQAMHSMEDIGFFCVDNLPPALIPVFYDLCAKSEDTMSRVAVVTDTRGGELFKSFFTAMEALKMEGKPYKILFLDASDEVLVRRFKETRRRHPLSDGLGGSLEQAVRLERDMLAPMREGSHFVMDTSGFSPAQLKGRIAELFLTTASDSLTVHCISFGFKFGIPMEADLVMDVRCLPNPFYDEQLRPKTGLDPDVRDYVMENDETRGFVSRYTSLLDYLLPLYEKEGKSQLVVAVGCTGGHHRSVALAQFTCGYLGAKGVKASVTHRDIQKY
ncbi:RNase adapter RapZ [Acutalibacter sp. 1XD8-33]|uniref:RNase adapter RapZ n=1 Tax=Acutalibacter sp. 1XD8-33 TaxID=2320081 RepID=UPI000EA2489B|nr:RNase adapter RapZ [Acutalibacter sp. 1XD8-33]RKJ38987.1 RNase adapter RapZ [Acutalibacter sp. 1XD8-33]